ncbi:MAG: hypothetical protein Q9226_007230 [Calogaya cf. arnoldii]
MEAIPEDIPPQAEPPPVDPPEPPPGPPLQATAAQVTATTVSTSTSVSLLVYTSTLPMSTRSISTATTSPRPIRSFTSPAQKSTPTPSSTANSTVTTGNSNSTSTPVESEPATTLGTAPLDDPPAINPSPKRHPTNDKLIPAIGVPLGCILIAAMAFCLLHRRKKHLSRQHKRLQHEEKLRNWYTPIIRRGPHELDTRLISRPYMKPELSEDARRYVIEVSAGDTAQVQSVRASIVPGPRKSRSTIIEEWIRNQPRTWI